MRLTKAGKVTATLLGVLASGLASGACGDAGGTAGRGGSGGRGGSAGRGGSNPGSGGAGAQMVSDAAAEGGIIGCTPVPVPGEAITDFSTYMPSAAADGTGSWGSATTLRGTTFLYGDAIDGGAILPNTTFDATAANPNLGIHVEVPVGSFAGIGFSFDSACSDASIFRGIAFTMSGMVGGAQARMLVETDEDYPVDTTANKGHCPWTDPAAKLSSCVPPGKTFAVPSTPMPTILGFGGFLMGAPVPTVDSQRLVGLRWQFECPPTDADVACAVDVTLDDIAFVFSLPGE